MRPELIAEDYRLLIEKILAICLAALTLAFWWDDAWGLDFDELVEYRSSLKIGIFAFAIFIGLRIFPKGIIAPAVIYWMVGLAYNPFLPLRLDKANWLVVHLAAGIALTWACFRIFRISKAISENQEITAARARAIQDALENGTLDRGKYAAHIEGFISRRDGS